MPTQWALYEAGPMTEPLDGSDTDADQALLAMPFAEAKEMVRPYMEIDGVEYTLADEDAEQWALKTLIAVAEKSLRGGVLEQPSPGAEGAADEVSPKRVFGPDDRYKINGQAHRQPYARIAKTWSADSVCTAFKAYNHHTALTAAHCVHDGPGGSWRTRHQLQFAAGSDRSDGTGQAKNPLPSGCYGRVVPGGWMSTRERQYDYAVLYLHGRNGAWCNYDDYNVGYYGYKTVSGSGISGYVAGYPDSSSSPNGLWGDLWYAARSDAWQSGDTIRYTIDGTFGQSGAPFGTRTDDTTSQFMGIHVAETSSYNIASRVSSSMIDFIKAYAGY